MPRRAMPRMKRRARRVSASSSTKTGPTRPLSNVERRGNPGHPVPAPLRAWVPWVPPRGDRGGGCRTEVNSVVNRGGGGGRGGEADDAGHLRCGGPANGWQQLWRPPPCPTGRS
eukprot:scaffold363_cov331-Pavlova_lutheri.AAC.74